MRKSTILTTLGTLFIVGGLALPFIAYVAAYFIPRKYTSQVTIEVKGEKATASPSAPESFSGSPDPRFVADQIQTLSGSKVLLPVIDEMKLADKWSAGLSVKLTRDQVYDHLAKMVKVSEVRNTAMIAIAVTSTDRQEAADIANTIAITYQKMRNADIDQSVNNALQELQVEVDKQRQKADAAAKEVKEIRLRDNLTEADTEPDDLHLGRDSKPLPADYIAAERAYINARAFYLGAAQKLASDREDMNTELDPVKIWHRAEPASRPSSPNVVLYMLVSVATGLFFALCGAGLLVSGRQAARGELAPAGAVY